MTDRSIKLLLDTNVWIDTFVATRPRHASACRLLDLALEKEVTLLYTPTSMKDVHYLVAAELKQGMRASNIAPSTADYEIIANTAWEHVDNMSKIGTAVGCDESDLWLARKYQGIHPDLEDNLIIAAAQRANADYLVTSDEKLILHSPVAALSPTDALALLQQMS